MWYKYDGNGNSWNTLLCRDGGSYHHTRDKIELHTPGGLIHQCVIDDGIPVVNFEFDGRKGENALLSFSYPHKIGKIEIEGKTP